MYKISVENGTIEIQGTDEDIYYQWKTVAIEKVILQPAIRFHLMIPGVGRGQS
jgi:hypothetical protein